MVNETSVVCPACDGDGWGIESDGLVTVMTEHGCRACTGSGRVSRDALPEATRIAAADKRIGG